MSMAVVGASSLQAFQTELVATLRRQLKAEPEQRRAFYCNSWLAHKGLSAWARTGNFIVVNAPICVQPKSPRIGRRLKLWRHSSFGEPTVAAELEYEDCEESRTEVCFSEDESTSLMEGSAFPVKTLRHILKAEGSTWENTSVLVVQPQCDSEDDRPSRTDAGPESRNPTEEATAANQQIDTLRSSPPDSVSTVKSIAEFPEEHLHGGWSGSMDQASTNKTQRTDFGTGEKELDPHRVYVGGIAFDFQGQEMRKALHQLFSQFGPVRNLEVATFGQDNTYIQEHGRHRGYAFVIMEDPEDAQAAITCLNGQLYWGRNLMVRQAFKKAEERKFPDRPCQLYVGNLNKTINNRELRKIFKRYGHVIQTKVIKEYITGKSRGFAFVTFAQEEEGQRAVEHMHGYVLGGSALVVNIAKDPKPLEF